MSFNIWLVLPSTTSITLIFLSTIYVTMSWSNYCGIMPYFHDCIGHHYCILHLPDWSELSEVFHIDRDVQPWNFYEMGVFTFGMVSEKEWILLCFRECWSVMVPIGEVYSGILESWWSTLSTMAPNTVIVNRRGG